MIIKRIEKLQEWMVKEGIDLYYLNTTDYHMSEYIPEYFKSLRYFSNFTGSLATLLISLEKAYLFVDGRYHIQADKEVGIYGIEVMKLGTEGVLEPQEFLKKDYKGKVIGFDGRLITSEFGKELEKNHILKDIDLISLVMEERVPLSSDPLFELKLEYTGLSRKEKLNQVLYCLNGKTHLIHNLESIAYLLNLRGNDILYTPVFLAYLLFYKEDVYFFIDKTRLSEEILDHLYEDGIIIRDYADYYEFLKKIKNEVIVYDPTKINYAAYKIISKRNRLFEMRSIVEDLKAIKNKTEQAQARLAHIYDGVSMIRFWMWLLKAKKDGISEYDCLLKLNQIRLDYQAFDLSFKPIIAYNANAAMMHYSPSLKDHSMLKEEGILLVDSGGQYLSGTTDITRTFALGEVEEDIKKHYTYVLKSLLNLSEVTFKKGMTGQQLDILARKDLWEIGIDYRCGTGHGVGHILSVHEAPPNVRYGNTAAKGEKVAFAEGHIFSDEPGVYLEGQYGIRIENLLLCQKAFMNEYGEFLKFETLTLCPYDLDLIDPSYLNAKSITLINDYHKRVYASLKEYLNEEEREFLKDKTREIK